MKKPKKPMNQAMSAFIMLLLSAVPIAGSCYYIPADVNAAFVLTEADTSEPFIIPTKDKTEALSETFPQGMAEETAWQPDPRQLNLAYFFPEDADSGDPTASYAAKALEVLMELEKNWVNGIYQNTQSIDTFRNIQIAAKDGDGNPITTFSNVTEIMSMANVYMYYQDAGDYDQFLDYAKKLWEESHSYTAQVSEPYYCTGCLKESEAEALLVEEEAAGDAPIQDAADTATDAQTGQQETDEPGETEASAATDTAPVIHAGMNQTVLQILSTPSDATPSDAQFPTELSASEEVSNGICPGHVDLIIHMKVIGLNGQNNLFTSDPVGNNTENTDAAAPESSAQNSEGTKEDTIWPGWNEETMSVVHDLNTQDWAEQYGLITSVMTAGNPLSSSEIRSYMAELPSDLSETRRAVVRYALESVGRVPYYWGGKASRAGYEGNRFGALVDADQEGRVLKGLDCSGWVSWVYWSATGNRLDYASTSGLAAAGIPVQRSELKPGDLIIRTGEDAHVIMFLGWTSDGRIRCIHESSESTGNVTLSVLDANWSYYRRLID